MPARRDLASAALAQPCGEAGFKPTAPRWWTSRLAREAYIEAALQDAHRFIAASQPSHSIGIAPPEKLESCGMDETGSPNALAEDEG